MKARVGCVWWCIDVWIYLSNLFKLFSLKLTLPLWFFSRHCCLFNRDFIAWKPQGLEIWGSSTSPSPIRTWHTLWLQHLLSNLHRSKASLIVLTSESQTTSTTMDFMVARLAKHKGLPRRYQYQRISFQKDWLGLMEPLLCCSNRASRDDRISLFQVTDLWSDHQPHLLRLRHRIGGSAPSWAHRRLCRASHWILVCSSSCRWDRWTAHASDTWARWKQLSSNRRSFRLRMGEPFAKLQYWHLGGCALGLHPRGTTLKLFFSSWGQTL